MVYDVEELLRGSTGAEEAERPKQCKIEAVWVDSKADRQPLQNIFGHDVKVMRDLFHWFRDFCDHLYPTSVHMPIDIKEWTDDSGCRYENVDET